MNPLSCSQQLWMERGQQLNPDIVGVGGADRGDRRGQCSMHTE